MDNVVEISLFRKNKPSNSLEHIGDVEQTLAEMKQQLFGDTRSSKEINSLFSEAKKQLRARGIKKIRVQHKDLPAFQKSRTIILEQEKLVFSCSISKDEILESGWKLISLNTSKLLKAIDLVEIVLTTSKGE